MGVFIRVVMPPTGAWYSIWATEREDYNSPDLLLDCLLPTGIIVQLKGVQKDAKLADIKMVLLTRATSYLLSFYRAMLCIRGTSHGPVSVCLSVCVCHKPVFY